MFPHLGNGISAHEHHARDVDPEVPVPGIKVDAGRVADGSSDADYGSNSQPGILIMRFFVRDHVPMLIRM